MERYVLGVVLLAQNACARAPSAIEGPLGHKEAAYLTLNEVHTVDDTPLVVGATVVVPGYARNLQVGRGIRRQALLAVCNRPGRRWRRSRVGQWVVATGVLERRSDPPDDVVDASDVINGHFRLRKCRLRWEVEESDLPPEVLEAVRNDPAVRYRGDSPLGATVTVSGKVVSSVFGPAVSATSGFYRCEAVSKLELGQPVSVTGTLAILPPYYLKGAGPVLVKANGEGASRVEIWDCAIATLAP